MTRKEEEKLLEDIMFIDSQQLQILQANPTSSILQALSYTATFGHRTLVAR